MARNYKINKESIVETSGATKYSTKTVILISDLTATFSVKIRFHRFQPDSGLTLLVNYCPTVVHKTIWLG